MSERTNGNSHKTLSHSQFYQLTECMKANRDGVTRTSGWRDCTRFLNKKLREMGADFSASEHSVADACKATSIMPSTKRKQGGRRTPYVFSDALEIVTRAVGRIMEELNIDMAKSPGLVRLLALARRETSLAELASLEEDKPTE